MEEFRKESKLLWDIAGPAILTTVTQYSLGALTQTFAGLVGDLELAAVSGENSVVAGLAFGVMLGMGSALETLCGQAYGAGKIRMLGIYMQRSWVILLVSACFLAPIYIWSPPILQFLGQTAEISEAAGKFTIWMLPQLFAYALNFPIQKFLQAQTKVWVMAWVSAVVLVLHGLLSWLFMLKLGWGLVGAAIMLNASWWLIVFGQLLYIFITTSDGAWSGFSWLTFSDLWGFVKLSLASAVMLCLEFWYLMILVVITGRLENPLIPVDAISICMNIQGWDAMIALGFNAAIIVRVSNDLGAGNSREAKIAVMVVLGTSMALGAVCFIVVLATRDWFPYLFTASEAVAQLTTELALILSITVLNNLQPVLSGRGRRRKRDISLEHHFHFDVFVAVIDAQLQELDCRFGEFVMELLTLNRALDPRNSYKSFDIDVICLLVEKYYPCDFTEQGKIDLIYQLSSFKIDVHNHPVLQSLSTIPELCRKLVETGRASRCCHWSRVASHRRLHQHWLLLPRRLACWHTPWIHPWFWRCWHLERNDRRNLFANDHPRRDRLLNKLGSRSVESREPSEAMGRVTGG